MSESERFRAWSHRERLHAFWDFKNRWADFDSGLQGLADLAEFEGEWPFAESLRDLAEHGSTLSEALREWADRAIAEHIREQKS